MHTKYDKNVEVLTLRWWRTKERKLAELALRDPKKEQNDLWSQEPIVPVERAGHDSYKKVELVESMWARVGNLNTFEQNSYTLYFSGKRPGGWRTGARQALSRLKVDRI